MTVDEKYNLLESCAADIHLLMTKNQALSQSFRRWVSLDELCIIATNYMKNSCTTYFYEETYYFNKDIKRFCKRNWSTYFSCPNQHIDTIKSYLEDIVLIVDNKNQVLWHDEEFFKTNNLFLVGSLVVTEELVANLLLDFHRQK